MWFCHNCFFPHSLPIVLSPSGRCGQQRVQSTLIVFKLIPSFSGVEVRKEVRTIYLTNMQCLSQYVVTVVGKLICERTGGIIIPPVIANGLLSYGVYRTNLCFLSTHVSIEALGLFPSMKT